MSYALATDRLLEETTRYMMPADDVRSPWPTRYALDPSALLLYAHPDDELLFAGGLMLQNPDWRWRLVRVVFGDETRDRDHARSVEMLRERGVNIVTVHCLGEGDEWLTAEGRRRWLSKIETACPEQPDVVFTHGVRGEYGHPHHIAVHHAAHVLYERVWDFLSLSGWPGEPQLARGRVHVVPCGDEKRELFRRAYPNMYSAFRYDERAARLLDTQLDGPEHFTR